MISIVIIKILPFGILSKFVINIIMDKIILEISKKKNVFTKIISPYNVKMTIYLRRYT